MDEINQRDWPEDFEDENGRYLSTCVGCGLTFKGWKRRAVCKLCSCLPEPHKAEDTFKQKELFRDTIEAIRAFHQAQYTRNDIGVLGAILQDFLEAKREENKQ